MKRACCSAQNITNNRVMTLAAIQQYITVASLIRFKRSKCTAEVKGDVDTLMYTLCPRSACLLTSSDLCAQHGIKW